MTATSPGSTCTHACATRCSPSTEPPMSARAKSRGPEYEHVPMPGLRLHLRRDERCSARRIPSGHLLERHSRGLVLPGLCSTREGRLRRDRSNEMSDESLREGPTANDFKLFICVQCGFEY